MVNATWPDLARLPLTTLFNCVTLKLPPQPVGQVDAERTYLPCRFLNLPNSSRLCKAAKSTQFKLARLLKAAGSRT